MYISLVESKDLGNMERRMTESTRYLCAAVQIDEKFCDQILEEFLEEDYTVIGICHGVDIPTVIKSCLLAKTRRNERNNRLYIFLPCLFLLGLFFQLNLYICCLIIYSLAWIIVFSYESESRYKIVGKYLLKKNFNPEFIRSQQVSPEQEQKLKEISESQDANVIIYGGFSPFVGSGLNINGWSFAVDIKKGKEKRIHTKQPIDFAVSELYDYITDSIQNLGLDNLSIEDNLYINGNGQELREGKIFLPQDMMRPNTRVEDHLIRFFIENPTDSIRHYRCLRVTDWKGEIILSIFLRLSKIGENLFIEANYYLLTPLRSYYRQYDDIKSEPSKADILKLAWRSAFQTFLLSISALISICRLLISIDNLDFSEYRKKRNRKKKKEKEIKSNPTFNYGAISSLRERVSQEEYQKFFQKLDQEMYLKIIERRIVDGLSKFLDSKNIDTSDFKNASSTILNHGIIVDGGSLQAENIAVGKRAKLILQIKRKGNKAGPTDGTDNDRK
ncbi:hypothetical protein [Microcoleus sp. BR0-C5]|uniref:hypothetical protein n=1 Tax=Microcoleus sp. BR0-C5 TaxID=2818713 RepID=UPI002FD0E020